MKNKVFEFVNHVDKLKSTVYYNKVEDRYYTVYTDVESGNELPTILKSKDISRCCKNAFAFVNAGIVE